MNLYGVTEDMVRGALDAEKRAGRIAPHVWFKVCRPFTPRSGGDAVEVQLEAYTRDRGRRYGNGGSYGRGEEYAATYDEWGWFLQRLYSINERMVCGSQKHPAYADRDDYERKTGATYRADLAELIARQGDPFPYVAGRNYIGRRGAGRLDASDPRHAYWGKPQPRTVEWVEQFRAGEVY
jgi:hypothetical protein